MLGAQVARGLPLPYGGENFVSHCGLGSLRAAWGVALGFTPSTAGESTSPTVGLGRPGAALGVDAAVGAVGSCEDFGLQPRPRRLWRPKE